MPQHDDNCFSVEKSQKQTTEAVEFLARQIADDQNVGADGIRTDVCFAVRECHRDEARRRLAASRQTATPPIIPPPR